MPTPRKRSNPKKSSASGPSQSRSMQPGNAPSAKKPSRMAAPQGASHARRESMDRHSNSAPHPQKNTTRPVKDAKAPRAKQSRPQAAGAPHQSKSNAGQRRTPPQRQQKMRGKQGSPNAVSQTNMAAAMWTKNGSPSPSTELARTDGRRQKATPGAVIIAVLALIGTSLLKGLKALGHGIKWLALALANLCSRSKFALAIVVVVVAFGIGYLVDTGVNMNKVNGNVSIGTVDVSGMTLQEAEQAVADKYSTRLNSGGVTIYANQQAMDTQAENPEVNEYVSVEETAAETVQWTTDANTLQARIDYESLAKQAMDKGRGGFFDRLQLFFGSANVPMSINYNANSLESLCKTVDMTLGHAYVNWGIEVDDGIATVTQGNDGIMVNRSTFANSLTDRFLCDPTQQRAFVAKAEYTPVQVDQTEAQAAADQVNAAIAPGATFTYEGQSWKADAATLGTWVQATVATGSDGNTILQPSFSTSVARAEILNHIQPTFTGGTGTVTFTNNSGTVMVNIDGTGQMPQVSDAVVELNGKLFTAGSSTDQMQTIEIAGANIPSQMTFDDAMSYGVITRIQEYTTSYTSGAEARNHNIHLAATLLDKSIAKANGGEWSFNDIAGECNAEKGFLAAGVIVDNDYTDEIGGGICQVATTVFNAVYEAGYPVTQRTNHSLYTSSYPAGRDAAISWPDLNLRWENDSTSDVLVRMSFTDTTLTCDLYGINPGYKVTSTESAWTEGEKYETKYTYDSTLSKGYTYTKTNGTNGKSITVTRTVKDAAGNVLHTDVFNSTYSARDEVIVRGGSKEDYTDEPQTNSTTTTAKSTT